MSARRIAAKSEVPGAVRVVTEALGTICGAAVLVVVQNAEVVYEGAFGELQPAGGAVTVESIFDLASITKLFTTSAILRLFDQRKLSLDDPIVGKLPEFARSDERRSQITYRHLLTHTSGLPAHVNFRDELGTAAVIARVCSTPLQAAPGTSVIYSDLGFILLGEAIARITNLPLHAAVHQLVCEPLHVSAVYRPPAEQRKHIVCTERDKWRGRILVGEVHDENCWAMGGVAGHAGLFGTANDVVLLAEMYRNGGSIDGSRILSRPTAQEATREQAVGIDERRGLGWALKASDHHSCGSKFSANSFGHTGYTGTSVWVDPSRNLTVVLLTNRVLYGRFPEPIRSLRAAVHDAVAEDLG